MGKTNFSNSKISKLLKNKIILITGGAGSVGSALAKKMLDFDVKQVRIIDINEHALFQVKRKLNDPRLRVLFGNITDNERLEIAGKNVDIIIHAAALKNIEITEFNAMDTININVNGTVNMINMAIKNEPKMFLNISTDKAAGSSTIYGTTKELGEKVTTWARLHFQDTKFASVRFGNVIETRGNVFEVWQKENDAGKPLSITDPNMKRYFFHIDEAVNFVLECLTKIKCGTVFIPKMKSYKIKELAKKISKNHKIIGLRPGEKMEEVLITDEERENASEEENMWILK